VEVGPPPGKKKIRLEKKTNPRGAKLGLTGIGREIKLVSGGGTFPTI